ncbi:unnamed protein product [Bursaphelenchus xylophilus]|uniref:Serpentine receptor class gamma n=1 Tax=Bursaphelenchus xylophilus TaxID=6326 RepID=A0A1I7SCE0_BURXY|nr:unnamed protein product [Bursaphelenchus xylophilus]CAG9094266.1 unnamed protein product [Bursaphelenchus xylophilus]
MPKYVPNGAVTQDYNFIVNLTTAVAIVVQVPFVIINARLFVVLYKRRHVFTSAFYQIVFYNGIVDILCVICTNYSISLPNLSALQWFFDYFHEPSYNLNIIFVFGRFYFNYASQTGILLMAMNRFSSIALMFHYDKIWKEYWNVILVLYLVPPFIFTFSLLLNRSKLYESVVYGITLKGLDYDHSITFGIPMAVRTIVYHGMVMLMAFGLNLTTIILLCKKGRGSRDFSANFFGYTIFVFVLHVVSFVTLLAYQNFRLDETYSDLARAWSIYLGVCGIPIIISALSLAPGVLLIVTSKDVRNAVFPGKWIFSGSSSVVTILSTPYVV